MARATLLIVARNRAQQFAVAMLTIWNRKYKDIDILVVDDGSFDDTPRITRDFSDVITRYHRIDRPGGYRRNPAEVLNIGHALSETDVVIEQGAEVCHLTDCVTPLLEGCSSGTVVLARVYNGRTEDLDRVESALRAGKLLPSVRDHVPSSVRTDGDRWPVPRVDVHATSGIGVDLYCGEERAVPFLFLGASHGDDFSAVGGYDEKLSGRNDEDLANRLLGRGVRFVFSNQAIAFHLLHGKS